MIFAVHYCENSGGFGGETRRLMVASFAWFGRDLASRLFVAVV